MSTRPCDLSALVEEYRGYLTHASDDGTWRELVTAGEWTPEGARTLLALATRYGSFVLRNAAAIAIALGVEDGDSGL